MASNFLSLYSLEVDKLQEAFDAKKRELLEQIVDPEKRKYATKIVEHDYSRDSKTHENPDGAQFIYAFQALVAVLAKHTLTIECYVDDEETPELFRFAWGESAANNYSDLPLSPYGTPAFKYKNVESLETFLTELENVNTAEGYANKRYLRDEDLEELISFLKQTIASKCGMFVFVSE